MMVCNFVVLFMLQVLHSEGQPLLEDPVRFSAKVLQRTAPNTCPAEQDTINAKAELRQNISTILADLPVSECGGRSWRRVAYLDMTDPTQSCPSGLDLKYYPGVRTCGRSTNEQYNNNTGGCWSTFYNTGASQYSRVCGRVRGYQFGETDAFRFGTQAVLDSPYLNGVSLTHGPSANRSHIWSFVSSHSNDPNSNPVPVRFCRCVRPDAPLPPPYVGNDYFCDSGNAARVAWGLYPDPLWDGQNCAYNCCRFNNPPYFTKILPVPTSGDIELRICASYHAAAVDIPIDQVEIYVHV